MTTPKRPTAEPESQPRSIGSILLAAFAIGFCIVAEGAIVSSRHRFSRFIEEFEMDVSVVTQFAIGPILPLVLAVIIVAAIIKELVPAFRLWLDRCNLAILLLGVVSLGTYIAGVFAPLLSLIESLS